MDRLALSLLSFRKPRYSRLTKYVQTYDGTVPKVYIYISIHATYVYMYVFIYV